IVGKDFWDLYILLGTFLFRKKDNVFSLWKRDEQYMSLVANIKEELNIELKTIKLYEIINAGVDKQYNIWQRFISSLLEGLGENAPILIVKLAKHKIFDLEASHNQSKLRILLENGDTKPATEISPYLNSLINVQKQTPSFFVSFVFPSLKNDKNAMRHCHQIFYGHFKIFVKERVESDPK
ncbi:MAG: hypothetical protein V3S46_05595, partial [Nitrospinota bacterium]